MLSPIALFAYNRLTHTKRTIEALAKNQYACKSTLIIFLDGPKGEEDKSAVSVVRKYLRTVSGFKSVQVIRRGHNWGLSKSIISGVTEVVNTYGRVIVMEDDLLTAPYFLSYMNDALNLYENEESVISIHGYIYPLSEKFPSTVFLRGADCWGWATWKRGWDLFEKDGQKLLNKLEEKKLTGLFDFNGAYGYTQMLRDQITGKNDSWAVRWYASAFLLERLTLYPDISLICNIGLDGAGTHCSTSDVFDVKLAQKSISVRPVDIIENLEARKAFEDYFRSIKPSLDRRILGFLKNYFNNVIKI